MPNFRTIALLERVQYAEAHIRVQGTYVTPPHVIRWVKHQVITNNVIKGVVIDTDMRSAYFQLSDGICYVETFESISLYPFNQSQDWDAMYVLQTR